MEHPDPARDIGTTLPGFVERVCGGRPITCPWAVFSDPFVIECIRLRRSYERGAIDINSLAAVLKDGVLIYDGAIRRLEAHDDAEARKKREDEDRKRQSRGAR